VEMMWNETAVV